MNRLFYLIILLFFVKPIFAQHTMGKVVGTDDKGKKKPYQEQMCIGLEQLLAKAPI